MFWRGKKRASGFDSVSVSLLAPSSERFRRVTETKRKRDKTETERRGKA